MHLKIYFKISRTDKSFLLNKIYEFYSPISCILNMIIFNIGGLYKTNSTHFSQFFFLMTFKDISLNSKSNNVLEYDANISNIRITC